MIKKEQLLYNTTQHLYNCKFFYLVGISLEIQKVKTTQFRNAKDVDVFIYDALLCNRLYQVYDNKVAVF